MQVFPRFRLPLRVTERRRAALRRNVQLLLVLVVLMAGLPFAFTPPAAANAVSAYGCTIDPLKPNNNDGKLAAKARIQCSSSLQGRAIRTELQQRRADGSFYTVAKSILVRDVPGVMTGQWHAVGSEWVGGCKQVSGTRKFKSIIMITDAAGNVTETASNSEEFGRDCVDSSDPVTFVSLVVGSNSLDDCESVEEELTDPAAEFTDPEVLFAQGNVEQCDGFVTSQPVPRADAEWVVAVKGVANDLEALPRSRQAGGGTQIFDFVPLTGNNSQDAANVDAKEEEILDTLAPDPEPEPETSQVEAEDVNAQAGCRNGSIGDRRQKSSKTKGEEPWMGGKKNGPRFRTTVYYKRISCKEWQILDVKTHRYQGTHPTRLGGNSYFPARLPQQDIWYRAEYDHGCKLIKLEDTLGWPNDHRWIFKPDFYFSQGLYVESTLPWFQGPYCDFRSYNMQSDTKLRGANR